MKQIIEGFRYDTEKAEALGGTDNIGAAVDSRSDFNFWEAVLYKTPRSGRYFLAGEGGPLTRFARPAGNNAMQWGERIIPLAEEDAKTWAEQNLSAEQYEEIFTVEDA
ncbi:MAG: hypothetical protein K9L68_12995 [Spirochaetales bacterium]|nr:hypothetical protein [Spirochaetales bacterium]